SDRPQAPRARGRRTRRPDARGERRMRAARFEWDGSDASGLAARIASRAPALDEVSGDVAGIIADVRARGDAAVVELPARFDATERAPDVDGVRVDPDRIAAALDELEPATRDALELAAANIGAAAEAQLADAGTA